jgi:hypothetical protein
MSESYEGRGVLVADGVEHPCYYRLKIYQDRRLKSGSGTLVSASDALWQAYEARQCSILMEDGRSFRTVVDSYAVGSNEADFKMSGGFVEAE